MIENRGVFFKKYEPYYVYHIPGMKVGITNSLEHRVEQAQGYQKGEYEVLHTIPNIFIASFKEIEEQTNRGYDVETIPDYKLFTLKNKHMSRTLATPLTTGFYCEDPNDLEAFIAGKITLKTPNYGDLVFDTPEKINWILNNIKVSFKHKKNPRVAPLYVYNKAAKNFLDCLAEMEAEAGDLDWWDFDKIRDWASERKLFGHKNSSINTQTLKVIEEMGELSHAVLKNKPDEIMDAIGDIVVVLTSIAELNGHSIEEAIQHAWIQIRDRKGGTNSKGDFIKDE